MLFPRTKKTGAEAPVFEIGRIAPDQNAWRMPKNRWLLV